MRADHAAKDKRSRAAYAFHRASRPHRRGRDAGDGVRPGRATAAIRTGSVQDPQGDALSLNGPVPDLKAVAVRYDDVLGSVSVTWTYYNDVRAEYPPNSFGARGGFSGAGSGMPIDQFFANWIGTEHNDASWSFESSLSVVGVSGTLSGTPNVSQDGRVVTVEFTHSMLAGHDWKRGLGDTGAAGDGYDSFWFDGYGNPDPPIYYPPGGAPTTPPGNDGGTPASQGMTINGGAQYTNDPDVTLSVIAPNGVGSLRVANDGGFRAAEAFTVKKTIRWRLAESGLERLPKTVYLRFGNEAQTFTDDIILDQTKPTVRARRRSTAERYRHHGSSRTSSSVEDSDVSRAGPCQARDVGRREAAVRGSAASGTRAPLRKFARLSRYKSTRAPKYVRVQDRAGNYSRWQPIR